MIHAESYLICSMAMCACALPLGGKMAGLPAPGRRPLSLAALLNGALSVLCLYASPLSPAALLGLPAGVALCFHRHGFPSCLRCALMTLCASMLCGGAMTALITAGAAPTAAAATAVGLCAAVYLLLKLLPGALCEIRQVELRANDHSIILPAMLDSGNLLNDPITGLGVLVIPHKAAQVLFPDVPDLTSMTALPLGFRLLNVRTAAGSALLPMFRPDECRIYVNGRACEAQLLAAVAGREYSGVQALVPLSAVPSGALSS